MAIKHKNFAKGVIYTPINTSATTITMFSGNGLKFPALTGSDYTYVTLRDVADTKREVCKLTGVSGDILTVERSASPFSWVQNDIIETTVVAELLSDQNLKTTDDPTFNSLKLSTTPTVTPVSGQLWYDVANQTLSTKVGTNSTLQIGQEGYIRAKNNSGSTVTNGQVVYITGAQAGIPLIALAKADAIATSFALIGVATEDITNTSIGNVTTYGVVRGLNTNSWTLGASVYISPGTAGQLTNVKPAYPNTIVEVGKVITVSLTVGEVLVNVLADHIGYLESKIVNGSVAIPASSAVNGTISDTSTVNSVVVGYRDVPANSQVGVYTLAQSDAGKSIDTIGNVTVPLNATVPMRIGTTITITNTGSPAINVSATGGVTLRQAGTTNTGLRTLAGYGMATLRKTATDTWFISGAGLS